MTSSSEATHTLHLILGEEPRNGSYDHEIMDWDFQGETKIWVNGVDVTQVLRDHFIQHPVVPLTTHQVCPPEFMSSTTLEGVSEIELREHVTMKTPRRFCQNKLWIRLYDTSGLILSARKKDSTDLADQFEELRIDAYANGYFHGNDEYGLKVKQLIVNSHTRSDISDLVVSEGAALNLTDHGNVKLMIPPNTSPSIETKRFNSGRVKIQSMNQ